MTQWMWVHSVLCAIPLIGLVFNGNAGMAAGWMCALGMLWQGYINGRNDATKFLVSQERLHMKTLIAFLALASSAVACDGALGLNDCRQEFRQRQRREVVVIEKIVERERVQKQRRGRQRSLRLEIERGRH